MLYRPHNPGHDYYDKGIYLITLVVGNRDNLLGELNMDARNPSVHLSAFGSAVMDEWHKTAAIQASKGRNITLHAAVCMPDHFHGVIEVGERMDKSLGAIIQYFKSACTVRYRELTGAVVSPCWGKKISSMGKEQRAIAYLSVERKYRPLFDDNYDDTICLTNPDGSYDRRHLSAMLNYVSDNPRRAVILRLNPTFMQRCLHVVIGGRDYAAFGNLFLLRWARKVQVFCHRKAPDGRTPYEQTEAYRRECAQWKAQVMQGATVIVTPGISNGERLIKTRCIESGYPLIHIQKEPIGRYWKPESSRFHACENGSLLILAPWSPETIGDVNGIPKDTDYSIFHNLNKIAEEICAFEGKAVVKRE